MHSDFSLAGHHGVELKEKQRRIKVETGREARRETWHEASHGDREKERENRREGDSTIRDFNSLHE